MSPESNQRLMSRGLRRACMGAILPCESLDIPTEGERAFYALSTD